MSLMPSRAATAVLVQQAKLPAKIALVIGGLYALGVVMAWLGVPLLIVSWMEGDAVLF